MSVSAFADQPSPAKPTGDAAAREALRAIHRQAESGQLNEALAALDQLAPEHSTAAYWHQLRGTVLQRLERYPEAEAEYTRALQKGSDLDVYAYANRGETRIHLKRLPEAVADLQRAVELDPQGQNPAAHRARALLISVAEMTRQAAQLKQTE